MPSITIKKTVPKSTSDMQSYDMSLEAVSASGMPKEIFVFKRGAPAGVSGVPEEPTDMFISIADPVDLEEFPVGAPDMAVGSPYFRTALAVFRFRSVTELQETWEYVSEDVQGLVDALNAASQPGTEETVVFS